MNKRKGNAGYGVRIYVNKAHKGFPGLRDGFSSAAESCLNDVTFDDLQFKIWKFRWVKLSEVKKRKGN